MNYLLILVIIGAFWLGVGALNKVVDLSRFKIESLDIMLVWRTERLNGWIDSLAQKMRSFLNAYAWLGVVASTAGVLIILYTLIDSAYKIFFVPSGSSLTVQVIVPGITIPLFYPLIALTILLFSHELSHGIIARTENIALKSVGLMLLVAIPGAFVEPDEEALKGARRSSRLKVYGAGSFSNFIVGGLALLVLAYLVVPSMEGTEDGIRVTDISKDVPAASVLEKGMVIRGINGTPLLTVEKFSAFLGNFSPGDSIILNTDRGDLSVTLARNPNNPERGYIGINLEQNYRGIIGEVHQCLYWISMLNINIGLMNLLPATLFLDGGKIVKEYLEMLFPSRTAGIMSIAVSVFSILLLAVTIVQGAFR